jgi:MFS family permease
MIFVDMTVVGVALPRIGSAVGMSDTEQTWIVTSYLLTLASLMAIGGRIGDLVGKVPAFVAGVVGFALASVVCANAHDGTQMIVGRVLQGLSACLMQPASSALVIGAFAPGERGKAMAVYVGIPLMFMALGPALGGVVVQRMGWPWVFWLNLPIAGAALVLTLIARPRDDAARRLGAGPARRPGVVGRRPGGRGSGVPPGRPERDRRSGSPAWFRPSGAGPAPAFHPTPPG